MKLTSISSDKMVCSLNGTVLWLHFFTPLEYYNGIFFLTTNMLGDFDEAILDRIQLKLRYDDLDPSARADIFRLLQARQAHVEEELRQFAEISLNGRQVSVDGFERTQALTRESSQIKKIVKVAHNFSSSEGVKLFATHLRLALTTNGYSIPAQSSLTFDNSLYDN